MTKNIKKLLISHVDDIHNIYHLFVGEIDAIWKATGGDPCYSILLNHYTDSPPGRWRVDLLKSLYEDVYIHELPLGRMFEDVYEIKTWNYGMVDNSTFSQITPSPFHIEMAERLKRSCGVHDSSGKRVVYIERGRSRILYDHKTKILLSDFLYEKLKLQGIEFDIVNFDDKTFQFQVEALSQAKVMLSCHGAANTNLFLLPRNATLLEINFRKYWFCDPVCSKHMTGEISYQTDCGGPLTWKETFHKAEYHNLAQFYGIGYREFEIQDAQNFINENPIELERIYVDGDEIYQAIVMIIKS